MATARTTKRPEPSGGVRNAPRTSGASISRAAARPHGSALKRRPFQASQRPAGDALDPEQDAPDPASDRIVEGRACARGGRPPRRRASLWVASVSAIGQLAAMRATAIAVVPL